MPHGIKLHISGGFACLTRPEMKVERISCGAISPSAALGILEAVERKPQIRWITNRILALAAGLSIWAPRRHPRGGAD